jgi:hypothetical protein
LTDNFSNDFAQWAMADANRNDLGERLAAWDVRDDLCRIVGDFCAAYPEFENQAALEQFYFCEGVEVTVPLGPRARTLEQFRLGKDGRRYFLAENSKTRVMVSVFLEAVKGPVKPDECKRSLEEKVKRNSSFSDSPRKGVTYRQNGEMQILEYRMAEVDGVPANQKNAFGCISRNDAFVDIPIS